jgi:hypothetical protein
MSQNLLYLASRTRGHPFICHFFIDGKQGKEWVLLLSTLNVILLALLARKEQNHGSVDKP